MKEARLNQAAETIPPTAHQETLRDEGGAAGKGHAAVLIEDERPPGAENQMAANERE